MKRAFITSVVFLMAIAAASYVSAQTPAGLEAGILAHFDKIEKAKNSDGNTDYEAIGKENEAIRNELVKGGRSVAVLGYTFSKLKEKMFIATSTDHRLRIYSWDDESGGTMRNFMSVVQYKGKSGKVFTWVDPAQEDEYSGGFVSQIFTIASAAGPIYLVNSTGIASTSLASQSLEAVHIVGDKYVPNYKVIKTASGLTNSVGFAYDFFSVVDHPERPVKLFFCNEADKIFKFPVVIEDDKTPQGRVTNQYITYKFDGKYFQRAK